MTHVDTSIFLHINRIFTIIDGLIFLHIYVPFDLPWFLYFFQETVITFIHFPAFPSELLLIQQ